MSIRQADQSEDVAFFTICTKDYFIGLVLLINSLRLLGHNERIFVLDCGLTPSQLALLDGHCKMVAPPERQASSATLFKAFGHAMHDGVSIIIDSDMIVTERLDAAIDLARQGKIVACNDPEADRWFAQWSEIFSLSEPLRREPYVCSAFVAMSGANWPGLLQRWWSSCERLYSKRVHYFDGTSDDPISQSDQDALNALLMSEVPAGSVARLPDTAVVHCSFQDAQVTNATTLACRRAGESAMILHWPGPKPWTWRSVRDWRGWIAFTNRNPFIVLMRRLLVADDVAIRVPPVMLPGRLRAGTIGAAKYFALANGARFALEPAREAARRLRGKGRTFLTSPSG